MKIAVLADIHGNLPALEAVLAKLEQLQPDQVIVNGDLINAVPFSPQVVDRISTLGWVVVRGNHEFYYLNFGTERAVADTHDKQRWGQLHWLVDQLSDAQGACLAMLPDDLTVCVPGTEPIRIAHGVPGRNRVGFYAEEPAEAIAAEIREVREQTLLSAHTHVQIDRHIVERASDHGDLLTDPHSGNVPLTDRSDRHWHVINPGSVGLPLNGDPAAQFAMLENVSISDEPGGWQATHYRVAYDRRSALESYRTTGMMEAGGILTQLFSWELITAEPEIHYFLKWCRGNGHDPDAELGQSFAAYCARSGRAEIVRALNPLENGT